ncbi:thioredoxin-disulfide reductase [Leptotrichia sp. oral taxon 212]|jgi:thioredoxin-disulfide reductase|uniref:thioredoxin-disulfide reductase n=1 Tax=Leptotrichia sp. oral taxon 212 TaxID=712357 RepID=UPI0006A96FBB|nr:thioredoxin-disulfide reductase [Leptotrichia sp. oral taxon 212]ALA96402.1 thioredoxin reductase [Leptotrichia sp. oral taxon 212]
MYDSVIIGSGPAGLTAAIYLSRAGLKNVIISGAMPGGQLTSTTDIENFPGFPKGISGFQLMEDMALQAANFGTETLNTTVTSIDFDSRPFKIHLKNNSILETRSIILSTGSTAKYLGIENEIESIGNGVSACATCDGFFYRGKEVLVIGGGDTAMEEATFLTKLASKVTLVHRRNELRASAIMQERARKNKKIEWKLNYTPLKVITNELGKVSGIELRNNETNETEVINTDGIFVAIGHKPNTDFLNGKIELDSSGYIITEGKSSKTNIPGVFAAGDIQDNKYQQAITAAGSGAIAALDAKEYLNENE